MYSWLRKNMLRYVKADQENYKWSVKQAELCAIFSHMFIL